MLQFRKAWSGVAGLFVVDPVIMPVSNNVQSSTFEQLRLSFPQIEWNQPRGQARVVVTTQHYLTPKFAQELSERMLCFVSGELPGLDFYEDAKRPAPIYFETDASRQHLQRSLLRVLQGRLFGKVPELGLWPTNASYLCAAYPAWEGNCLPYLQS